MSDDWWNEDEASETNVSRATTDPLPIADDDATPTAVPIPALLGATEPDRRLPAELKRIERLNRVLVSFAVLTLLAALGLLVVYFWPAATSSTTVVEIRAESYDDASGVAGVTETSIRFGMSVPLSGERSEIGAAFQRGVRARLFEQNDLGGVARRELKLDAIDDQHSPELAAKNVNDLLEKRRVFALIGGVGAETSTAMASAAGSALLFAPLSGSDSLRSDPPLARVFHVRASLSEELSSLIIHLVNQLDISPRRIAVVTPQNPWGDSGFRGAIATFAQYNVPEDRILRIRYDSIDDAARELVRRRARYDAVLALATYEPAGKLVRRLRNKDIGVPIALTSAVGTRALASGLRGRGARYTENVVISQVVPPFGSDDPGVVRYRKALAKHFPDAEPGFISLEGYLAAGLLLEGLSRIEGGITVGTLVRSLESMREVDLGVGYTMGFAPDEHQASHRVWVTKVGKNGGVTLAR